MKGVLERLGREVLVVLVLLALVFGAVRSCRPGRFGRVAGWARHGSSALRPPGTRMPVDPASVWVDDGDTIRITWPGGTREAIRILGIDAPEVRHRNNPGVADQPHGQESLAFARRHILGAHRLELLRASHRDRFQRSLGYLFVDGVNYSVLAIENHMAESTIDRFGDSGFPREAAEVHAASRRAGPPPFESPIRFRERMSGASGGSSQGPDPPGSPPSNPPPESEPSVSP